jgi:hypothetical protein
VTPDEVPRQLIDILDRRAGRKHSRDGVVVTTLAEILTRYDELRAPSIVDIDWTYHVEDRYASNTEEMIEAEDPEWKPPPDATRPVRSF